MIILGSGIGSIPVLRLVFPWHTPWERERERERERENIYPLRTRALRGEGENQEQGPLNQ